MLAKAVEKRVLKYEKQNKNDKNRCRIKNVAIDSSYSTRCLYLGITCDAGYV